MTDFYKNYFIEWREKWLAPRLGNGYLERYHDAIAEEWRAWLYEHEPMTRSRYKAEFTRAERMRHGPVIWHGELRSGGEAEHALEEIFERYSAKAKEDAAIDRARAGWTGENFLTAPDGTTHTKRGTRYGPYAGPDAHLMKRKWYEVKR